MCREELHGSPRFAWAAYFWPGRNRGARFLVRWWGLLVFNFAGALIPCPQKKDVTA